MFFNLHFSLFKPVISISIICYNLLVQKIAEVMPRIQSHVRSSSKGGAGGGWLARRERRPFFC
jgi:hypothetical protein